MGYNLLVPKESQPIQVFQSNPSKRELTAQILDTFGISHSTHGLHKEFISSIQLGSPDVILVDLGRAPQHVIDTTLDKAGAKISQLQQTQGTLLVVISSLEQEQTRQLTAQLQPDVILLEPYGAQDLFFAVTNTLLISSQLNNIKHQHD